jgi:hypothetical protein
VSTPPLLEPRLQRRYQQLVQEQLAVTQPVAAGLRALPGAATAFASTQAAWRFYRNDQVSLTQLAQPLLDHARQAIAESCTGYALVVHDWSLLHYNDHDSKQDRVPLSQTTDLGYNLQSALVVSDRTGDPLAPVFHGLHAADGVHSSLSGQVEPPPSQLDGLAPVMAFVEQLHWDRPAVHVVDAEADSIAHFRHWHRANYLFVVRADDCNRVVYAGATMALKEVREQLQRQFQRTREVEYHGSPAYQYVAETTVTVTRKAKLQRQGKKGPRTILPGEALQLRLVMAEVRDAQGKVLACWYLLTNVPQSVLVATVALWYYWRWRIESYFKLLKGAGHQLENWQQETAGALVRRLLVVSMACVMVWQIARSTAPEADQVRDFLIRLSGRQMKKGQSYSWPALLAGLWVFLAMVDVLEHCDFQKIKALVDRILPRPTGQPPGRRPPDEALV